MSEVARLSFAYEYDASFFNPDLPAEKKDDFGRLTISVATDRFSGRGCMWVQWQDVKEFGEALAAFPITEDAPIVGRWGYNDGEGDDLILRVEIASADKRGNIVVRFEVADYVEPAERVKASFLTNYPEIEAFRLEIAKLMDGDIDEAVLTGR